MSRYAPPKSNQDHPLSITVECPACFAPVSAPCTAPTDTGRRRVTWFHSARTTAALEARNTAETSESS